MAISIQKYGLPFLCLAVGLSIWFCPPFSSNISSTGMHLLAVFVSIILSLILTEAPISIVSGLGLCLLVFTQSLFCRTKDGIGVECWKCGKSSPNGNITFQCDASGAAFEAALQGFSHEVNWLVFAAFHLGTAVESSGLGKRASLAMVKFLGKTLLGLGYAIFMSEILLALLIPSNTARGAGIMMPIVLSIAKTLGSHPNQNSRLNGGEFLVLCGSHANLISASFYPTGMAANPLISANAKDILGVDFSFLTWVAGNVAPGLVLVALTPLLLYKLSFYNIDSSQEIKDRYSPIESEVHLEVDSALDHSVEVVPLMERIRAHIQAELALMGTISYNEIKLLIILVTCCSFWITNSFHGLDTAFVAMVAVLALVLAKVLSWNDVIGNEKAWDTFWWLGILIMMANQMEMLGVAEAMGGIMSNLVRHLHPVYATIAIGLMYFYGMYVFSSLTGHIMAFSGSFMRSAKSLNAPSYLVTAFLAYFSTLCGCLTTFSSGPVVIYFSQNYLSRQRWFAIGFLVSVLYITIYFSVGLVWWKILGWW